MRMLRGFVVALTLVLATGDVFGCPNCKEAIANQEGGDAARLARGYSWSILGMIAMPFALLGTGAFLVVRAARRGSLPEL